MDPAVAAIDWKLGLEIAALIFTAGGAYRALQTVARRQDEDRKLAEVFQERTTATLSSVHDESAAGRRVAEEALRQATVAHARVDSVQAHVQQLEVAQARADERIKQSWLRTTNPRIPPVED